ncbi:cyclophane-forming radical SAM/SPASM peptide maturase GrrM/OscB [Synechococcus sp. MIT S1220]|uniref:cyclophane-forming radical SAM/SPASM peptide maturase GrrM/OscB n=1 Tax=Synechococcus sp. MIT S1220 TaxID=3082549 RepID=UPI0039AF2B51
MGQWWWLEKRQRRICELVISSTTASATDLSAFGPIGLVVVQSTSLCNLDCSYCYLPDRQKKRVFDLKMLPLLIQRILESPYAGPEFSLVWHAGEPLTLPTSWYDEATAILHCSLDTFGAKGLQFDQHVQTNATLINDDWCDCFHRNRIVVGISVDGPIEIHDAHRCFRNGRGSHALAMNGIEALHRNDVPFHCISVLTSEAMEQPERMYRFFRDHGIHDVGFNVEEQEGINTTSSMQGSEMEEKYTNFLRAFWRLSEQDGYPVILREFDQVIGLIQGEQRMKQNELNRPFSILSVDSQGNFSTFDPELLSVASDRYGTFNLGNLRDLSLVESTQTDQFKRLLNDMSRGVDSCQKSCEYFGLCGGGNGSNKFWEHGTLASSETHACRFGTQIPVQVLLERFEEGPPLQQAANQAI